MNFTFPFILSFNSLNTIAVPSIIEVCISCPQACIISGTLEEKERSLLSLIGSASISPLSKIVFPPSIPVRSAIIPWPPIFSLIFTGNFFNCSVTLEEVLISFPPSSGCSCRSLLKAIISFICLSITFSISENFI